jgi:hypothetical protein
MYTSQEMPNLRRFLARFLVVRAMLCFMRGVFRVPKNGMRKTNKPPAMRVVENA